MDSYTYIKERQVLWAKRRGITLQGSKGERGYPAFTLNIGQNLFEPLSRETECQFQKADGKELGDGKTPGKIQAVYSSSALVCNMFHYWQPHKDLTPIAHACRIPQSNIQSLEFETKLPICDKVDRRRFPHDPNIDVLVNYFKGQLKAIGIECKFAEAYSSRKHDGLRPAYIQAKELWTDIPEIYTFAQSISPEDSQFQYLHAAQLIKHILGLKYAFGRNGFRLIYLWYDVPFDDGYRHRCEIEQFAEIVKRDGIIFQAITYQEVILNLAGEQHQTHQRYVDYIEDRYL